MGPTPKPSQLQPQTLKAFENHIHNAELGMEQTLDSAGKFLWSDANPQTAEQVRSGRIFAEFWTGKGPQKVPHGLIHDWVGAGFIPGSTVADILSVIQNYDNHKDIYQPEVIASKLIRLQQDDFQIYLRLLKKKIITVVLDTDHDVHYIALDRSRWLCRSYTTRIAEVENAGKPEERVLPPDTGYGFLWRLYSYWRFEDRDGGAAIECRAISLTRDIPFGLGWAIAPIVQKLPEESLINTLECTRKAVQAGRR